MVNYNFENKNSDLTSTKSGIIHFNEFLNEQQMKRYLIFGKGSISEFGTLLENKNSISSSNGFFSIITAPESTISIFQSKGFHVIEDFKLDFHSKYISKNPVSKISTLGNIANSQQAYKFYNVTGNDVTIAIIDTGVDFQIQICNIHLHVILTIFLSCWILMVKD